MSFVRKVDSRGHKYRQLVHNVWDPAKKCSVTKILKHLGPVDDMEKKRPTIPLHIDGIESACSAGHLALFHKISGNLGLPQILDTVCPSEDMRTANALMALVFNQLNGRRPLKEIGPWLDATPLGHWMDVSGSVFTKDILSNAMDDVSWTDGDITIRKALAIQSRATEAWRSLAGRDPSRYYFYYDIAKIRYNGNACSLADNGYSPKANGRPHVGLGLVTSRGNHFPVMSLAINGATNDSRTFDTMADGLKAWQLKNITLVLDRGIMNSKSVNYARTAGFHVLGGCNENSKEVEKAIREWKDDEIERSTQIHVRPGEGEIYFQDWEGDLFGQHGRFVLTLDPTRRTRERGARHRMMHELRKGVSQRRIRELRGALGEVVKTSIGRRGWRIDDVAEEHARKADGRFLLFTTDMNLKAAETVGTYRQRDEIEKSFRDLNGSTNMGPIRYRLANHVEPYLTVVCHLSYLERTTINWLLRRKKRLESVDQAVTALRGISEVRLLRKGVSFPRWTRLSEQQEELVNLFDISDLFHSN
jgi:transposase